MIPLYAAAALAGAVVGSAILLRLDAWARRQRIERRRQARRGYVL